MKASKIVFSLALIFAIFMITVSAETSDDAGVRNTYWNKNYADYQQDDSIKDYDANKQYDDVDANAIANADANAVANANVILKLILGDAEIPQYGNANKPMGADKENAYNPEADADANATAIANANANANIQVIFIQKDAKNWSDKDEMKTFDYWYNKYIHPETGQKKYGSDEEQKESKYDAEADTNAVANAEANAIANAKANIIFVLILGDDDDEIPEYKMYQNDKDNKDYKSYNEKDQTVEANANANANAKANANVAVIIVKKSNKYDDEYKKEDSDY